MIRQPVGPVATFTPWNFPIYLLAKKVSAALAASEISSQDALIRYLAV